MTATVQLICAVLVGVIGLQMVVAGASQRRPAITTQLQHLQRSSEPVATGARWAGLLPTIRRVPFDSSIRADLQLLQRPVDAHAGLLVAALVGGFFGTLVLCTALRLLGVLQLGVLTMTLVALIAAAFAPLIAHSSMRSRAAELRNDLRYQLSAYLDVVTMLLAGNVGNEGSLRQAALTGDGRLFVELRRRILIAETSNRSIVTALAALGDDLGLVELQQIAASAALGSSVGAPMARSLHAKCATLRSALASDQEADARVRTGKITIPLVAMSLLIMAAVIYPALNFSR